MVSDSFLCSAPPFCLAQISQLDDLRDVRSYHPVPYIASLHLHFKVHPEIGERALRVARRHLDVLAGPLVILALAAPRLDSETKEAMGRKLHELQHQWTPGAIPLGRSAAPPDFIEADGSMPLEWYEVYDVILRESD